VGGGVLLLFCDILSSIGIFLTLLGKVTNLFFNAGNEMHPMQVCGRITDQYNTQTITPFPLSMNQTHSTLQCAHLDNFTLNEAMSAVEVMDPKVGMRSESFE
jgi:hypothetical protein